MKSLNLYIIIALLICLIGLFLYSDWKQNKLKSELIELRSKDKVRLKRVRDSAYAKIDSITVQSKKRFDSILNIPPTIKYIPYEKAYYIDRSIDDAISILSNYRYNTTATRAN